MKRFLFAATVVAFASTAHAQVAPQNPHPGEPAAATPQQGSAPGDPAGDSSEEQLLETADEITRMVGEIRGLEAKGPISKGIKKRDELRAVLMEKLAEEVSDEDIEAEAKVFKRLGVIPEDLDYKKVLLDVLTEQIAGFYDQKSKELYIMQGIAPSLQRPAMAHEIFHALQDQHFDILSMQEPFETTENSDFALARSALLEGDATVLMFDFSLYESKTLPQGGMTSLVDIPWAANMLRTLSFDDLTNMEQIAGTFGGAGFDVGDSALAKAPAIFRESLVFPYFAGMRFIVMARSGRTWADVDRIYADPPVSTEQILHPEKYFAGDDPVSLSLNTDLALPGWKRIQSSVLGEFQLLQILKAIPGAEIDPASAAEGWDGDRILAYESPEGKVAVVIASTWDSHEDAREFAEATLALARKRYPDALEQKASGEHGESSCLVLTDRKERLYVERWGDTVLYVEGTPSELDANGKELNPATHHVRQQAWKTMKRRPFSEHVAEALLKQSPSGEAPQTEK